MPDGLLDSCIYTIATEDRLLQASSDPSKWLEERKRWVRGSELFEQAAGRAMPIVFADATNTSRLIYWAVLTDLKVIDRGTRFRFTGLTPIRGHSQQELRLLNGGKTIAPGYRRPYALCRTPSFLLNPRRTPGPASRLPVAPMRRRHSQTDELGVPYRPADETKVITDRDPFKVDPEVVDRGTRGHRITQNALAEFLVVRGVEPLSPAPGEPEYDLAWRIDNTIFVAEVKSLTVANEEKQLRLGLGQVLRYRHILGGRGGSVVAVLAVERKPRDAGWLKLCRELGVHLLWPERFSELPG